MNNRVIIVLLASLCLGCSRFGNNPYLGVSTTPSLVFKKKISFALQDNILYLSPDVVFSDHNGKQQLYLLDETDNEIDILHLKDSRIQKLSENPIYRNRIDGFGVLGDQYFIYNYHRGAVCCYNNGQLIDTYVIQLDDIVNNCRTPYPYVQTLSPIKTYRDFIIMTGFRAGETGRSADIPDLALMILDRKSGKITYAVEMPEIYGKYNWGGGFTYRMPYYDLGPNGDVVCCFAASEDLAVYSMENGSVRYVKAPSRYIKKIRPFSKRNRNTPDSGSEMNWYRNNPSYDGILYDKWREVYYRFALQPERPGRKGGAHAIRKPVSIIVLDKDLNPLGETLLDEDVFFRPYCSFVSPEGLFIQVLDGDEDHLTFYQYQYEKNI